MAEAKSEDSASSRLRMYDERDELEIFSVELMRNLMKHFNDANFVVMPNLPRASKYYTVTILKSVALGWRFSHTSYSQRFRKAFPFMSRGKRQLFTVTIGQATKLFEKMYSYAQLVFLAAYCYELSRFLSRNGLEEYIYVSYSLFSTIFRDFYEAKFYRSGGWAYAEKALRPFVLVFDASEEVFKPDCPLKYEDLFKALQDSEKVGKRNRGQEPGNGEAEGRGDAAQRRPVNRRDWKVLHLNYVVNSESMRFSDDIEVTSREMLMEYLKYRAIQDRHQRNAALLKSQEDSKVLPDTPTASRSEDSTSELSQMEASTDISQMRLDSCSIRDEPDNAGSAIEGQSVPDNAGSAIEGQSVPDNAGSAIEGQSVPDNAGSAIEGQGVPDNAMNAIEDQGVSDIAVNAIEDQGVPDNAVNAIEDQGVPDNAESAIEGQGVLDNAESAIEGQDVPHNAGNAIKSKDVPDNETRTASKDTFKQQSTKDTGEVKGSTASGAMPKQKK